MKNKKIESIFLLPSLLGVLLFFLIPFIVIIYYSLINNPMEQKFVFLDNFSALLDNSAFILAAKNTAIFSLLAVPLAVILSLALALLLESKIPYKSQFRTFFLSPMMVPVASVVLVWKVVFNFNGPINSFIAVFGLEPINWLKSDYSQLVIIILFLWKNLGYNMILFMAGLNSIPKTLLEVAEIENASPWFKFVQIKLRFISPTILFVALLSLINSFKVFREIHLLTGDYPYDSLYMLQHFMNNTFKALDYQKLATAAILMGIVMIVIIGILFIIENYFGKDVEG
ncbi:multiple sugar transport system permease protein [Maledivibacter halophilus]|uniref:Multiple sugar transport system permease protein n=1 Tax=Maledivibacter halophilus TaxID=36842 RepID=A0A1T5LLD2_9FIRM|nr:multiple sugar transport system permease protein [Maledivibacter halophilus]